MCAPSIVETVRQELSRRHFLAALGGAIAATTVGSEPAVAQQKPIRLEKGFRDTYDLTHTFSPKTPVFPAFKPVQIKPKFSIAQDGFFANEITFDEHTGTHMDAPVHFVASGSTADRLSADRFFAPLAVVLSVIASTSLASGERKKPDSPAAVAWKKVRRPKSGPNIGRLAGFIGWQTLQT